MKSLCKRVFFIILLQLNINAFCQTAINTNGTTTDSSAMLDVKSTNKGALWPRMTLDQRNAIASPADGLMVFCVDCGTDGSLSIFANGAWRTFSACFTPSASAGSNTVSAGQIIWNWTGVAGAAGYKWNTTNGYTSATDMVAATTKTETGILCDTTYSRYVWTYNNCGVSEPVTLSQTISGNSPGTPIADAHTSTQSSIIWNWYPVSGATGYKWNTTDNYATANDMIAATTKTETGLTCNTAYNRYVWAYNDCGYSTPVTLMQSTLICWNCGLPITDGRDGKSYNTVQIGSQCWMTQNLNLGTMITNTAEQLNNGIIEKYCINENELNCNVYGGLYQWAEMVQYLNGASNNTSWNPVPNGNVQGICPAGWHLPTDAEWCTMTIFLDASVNCNIDPVIGLSGTDAGGRMKEEGSTNWASPNTGATNSSGFTALPAGFRNPGGGFYNYQYFGFFWAATGGSPDRTYTREVRYNTAQVSRGHTLKTCGFSVRCLMD
jgi:uncharacterized protein (TIGR02145 family)